MQIIRNREVVDDGTTHLQDQDAVPSAGSCTVSLSRWLSQREALRTATARIGVRLETGDDVDLLAEDAAALELVAVNFPKFSDGRGYSQAYLLRTRYGFRGELRAMGYVLRDQLFYLHRCGFDAFELAPGRSLEDALLAFSEYQTTYQASADESQPLYRRTERGAAEV